MQVFAQPFWAQKAGNTPEEYEDAFWPRRILDQEEQKEFRFAVADGATETSFSGIWAKQLVRMFCSREQATSPAAFVDKLPHAQRQWQTVVNRKRLSWYAEEKARAGAFSAFLGLTLRQFEETSSGAGNWHAIAIGDCCLVHLRGDEILRSFPLQSASEFNNRPILLSSNPNMNDNACQFLVSTQGQWVSDDAFYLMTDALAAWFLAEAEEGNKPWSVIRDLDTLDHPVDFAGMVRDLRVRKRLRNDDATLIRVDVLS